LLAQIVGRSGDQRPHLVDRPGPVPLGATAHHPQHPDGLDVAVPELGCPERVAGLGGPSGRHGVMRVGLALPPASLPVRTVDLHHRHPFVLQIAGQAGAVAARPLHTHHDDLAVRSEPAQQSPIARRRGRERLDAEQSAELVKGGHHVDIEVGVDPTGDLCCHCSRLPVSLK
jgi:hypothetical protein